LNMDAVCSSCWPDTRADLNAAGKANPSIAGLVGADLAIGDLNLGPQKGAAESKIDLGLGAGALSKLGCQECGAGFNEFRTVRGCNNCEVSFFFVLFFFFFF
jgi:hypothetical protein